MFYVYVYMDPTIEYNKMHYGVLFKYEPFYIGKGKGDRCNHHLKKVLRGNFKKTEKNKRIKEILDSGESPIIEKILISNSESESLNREVDFIIDIGRVDRNKGTLLNKCDGGLWPLKNYKHSTETLRKISESRNAALHENFKLISPNGEIYTDICLLNFCEEHNMNYQKIRKSKNKGIIKVRKTVNINESTLNCEGWEFIDTKRDMVDVSDNNIYTIISPCGDVYEKNKNNIIEFCEKMSLSRRTFMTYRNSGKINIKNKKNSNIETINCEGWEFISEDGSENIIESIRSIKYKLISPDNSVYFVNNLLKFTIDNSLSYRTLQTFMDRGKIKNKEFLIRKSIEIKNTQNWEIVVL